MKTIKLQPECETLVSEEIVPQKYMVNFLFFFTELTQTGYMYIRYGAQCNAGIWHYKFKRDEPSRKGEEGEVPEIGGGPHEKEEKEEPPAEKVRPAWSPPPR